jgi:uracil-DNA glycosylase
VVIGQAPGIRAQTAGLAWDDASGQRLMRWMGVDEATFRDPEQIAHLPMDFYYPGKGKSGDIPPRRDFAPLWHDRLMALMPDLRLALLVGQYAQRHYLGSRRQANLTQTVHNYQAYLPDYFPIVHPSPLNFRWLAANPWFEQELVPVLQQQVRNALSKQPDSL